MAQKLSENSQRLVESRIPGFEDLTPEEQAVAAVKVIANDFYLYCERNLMIKDKVTSQIVPFVLNWAQKKLVKLVLADLEAGVPVRYIILKARQMGLSTVIEALCFWWTTTHRYQNSVIIAHETEASKNLYNMFRRYYESADPVFQPDRKYNTKKDLVFDVEDDVKRQYQEEGKKSPGLGSQIKTLVAKEGKGRSDTINFFHGSEVAFWESTADVISGALQAVPLAPNTFAFLESTANGLGGFFYDEWQFAKKGESAFKPIFFAWHEHPEYEIEGSVDVYSDEEKELLDIFQEKLDEGQDYYEPYRWNHKLLWRREKKKEFRSDPAKFYQEYPKDDMEAFLASGRPVFDVRQLVKMEQYAQKHGEHKFGSILENPDKSDEELYIFEEARSSIEGTDPTPLKVWHLPEQKEYYTIGVDVSEGIEVSSATGKINDFSVIDVMDSRLRTVARWRGHIDPDLLAEVAFKIGIFYNKALIGVELNNHGLTVAQGLRNRFYPKLYMRETSEDEIFQERTTKFGWQTNRKTKPKIINNLVKAIRDGVIIDLDIVFIREAMTYVRDDQGRTAAQEGMFDDTVMAKAINLEMAEFNSINQEYARENIQKPIKRKNGSRSSESIEEIAAGKRRSGVHKPVGRRRKEKRAGRRQRRRR